ncbi:MAG: hypothetical protein EOO69_02065 [Moraxellaceae bacterium]|nr:MAG: hypothetical protein EOO69_02065 [Moraxellaceae bacterium]
MVKNDMLSNTRIITGLKKAGYSHAALLGLIAAVMGLTACQSIQPYNGKTGYQREPSNPDQVIISYTLDSKTTDAIINQKLQKACAKELGLALNTPVKTNILDQKEFVNLEQQDFNNNNTNSKVPLGNSDRTSFGLSTTPKLSNSSNTAGIDMLNTSPHTLKQVTVACLGS